MFVYNGNICVYLCSVNYGRRMRICSSSTVCLIWEILYISMTLLKGFFCNFVVLGFRDSFFLYFGSRDKIWDCYIFVFKRVSSPWPGDEVSGKRRVVTIVHMRQSECVPIGTPRRFLRNTFIEERRK